MSARILIALGANQPGRFGEPIQSMRQAIGLLASAGLVLRRSSEVYMSRPVGPGCQSDYLNAVAEFETTRALFDVLRILKQTERAAGRSMLRGRWRPRPLDLDLLSAGRRRIGPPRSVRRRPPLQLPHPEMLQRAFVLLPMADVAPHWRHPVAGLTPNDALLRLSLSQRKAVKRTGLRFAACTGR
jgi:2-amino-4-hydroxy-6-hydroxymethyldihydropteridine diphosphokinase